MLFVVSFFDGHHWQHLAVSGCRQLAATSTLTFGVKNKRENSMRQNIIHWLLALCTLAAVPALANGADSDSIEQALKDCMDEDYSTAGMVSCIHKAHDSWDKMLNIWYSKLMDTLPAEDAKELQKSQRQWLAFRDAEFEAINAVYRQQDGTMYHLIRTSDRADIVESRAKTLRHYYCSREDLARQSEDC